MDNTNEVVVQAANVTLVKSQARTIAEGIWFLIRDIVEAGDARPVDPAGLDSLAADMGRQGQLESALLIKQADGSYKMAFGNRRLAAAKKLGWEKLKVDIKENVSESERLQMILSENSEREDVSPFYTAALLKRIMAAEGIDQEELARRLGKDAGEISRLAALGELAPEVQEKLGRPNFSMSHIREIMRLPEPEEQLKMADGCEKGDWSSKALRAKVDQALAGGSKKVGATPAEPETEKEPFQFVKKGKFFNLRSEMPANVDDVDEVYMRGLRIALVDFLIKEQAKGARMDQAA